MFCLSCLSIVLVSSLLFASFSFILLLLGLQFLVIYSSFRVLFCTLPLLSVCFSGVQLSSCGEQTRRCVRALSDAAQYGEASSWMILAASTPE
ncbi:hypothetical protein NUU24_26290 [Escherichia coli]|uniref:hypothetical protein n=1 Tax=Escherichia coli TaxID=562 RepID=UPI0021500988|nr:hypothetical protein [Escherichia coli]MCR4252384.1 hypothetical protein [Escherichia coli]